MKTIQDFNFKNKKALIRVDFNVPLNNNFEVTDATRIEAAKPTIKKILEDGGSVVLMSHLGRPKGVEAAYSLNHIVEKVTEVLGVQVKFVADCIGEKVTEAVNNLQNGEILLLENLRFYAEETAGDDGFSKQLANNGDIYVNDAFGTAHRAHASTTIIAKYFSDNKCFGSLLATEIESIDIDPSCKPIAETINMRYHMQGRFFATVADMCDYTTDADVAINTSCEHLTQEQYDTWLDNLEAGTKVVLQSNNYFEHEEHVRCVNNMEELIQQSNVHVSYVGELEMPKYTRYMIIGKKYG